MGCKVKAKNTLDLNYLALAAENGAEIRPLHLVSHVEPSGAGWRVHYDEIADNKRRTDWIEAKHVVLAAGSLGSTEIMLRSRLAGASVRLGHGWSANGDFLTPAISSEDADPTVGPTISACIDHTDGDVYGEHIFIQDGGMPNLLRTTVGSWHKRLPKRWQDRTQCLMDRVSDSEPLECIMPWFAQGIDASDGRLFLGRRFFGLLGRERLKLDWDITHSESTVDAIVKAHKELARATGGKPLVSPTWTLLRDLITPHPLGGCNMANDRERGVVEQSGMDEDRLVSAVSLPMWFPPVKIEDDDYIDAVYLTDGKLEEAIRRGADEIWDTYGSRILPFGLT